ncbi:glycosyltransferase [Anaeromyxobacter sp. SG26]|uniref:glycosyltransferase n=1 Tax=Anaeromyxobacter sp. SG26 TaxID=2925407 RepID=UPI001F55DB48|nr:glycosyltransferase [Anaeromyxobacter sp. SG26]
MIALDASYVPRIEPETAAPGVRARGDAVRNFAFQVLAVLATVLGGWYLAWRWTASLNPDALGFAVVIAAAETLAYLGAVLFFLSIWRAEDPPAQPAPRTVNELRDEPLPHDRPIKVDVMLTTYDEPVGLVRLSVRDAKQLTYPFPLTVRVYVLDDGRRPEMRRMAGEEGVGYLSRATNEGYKAGNLRNGLEHSDGDLVVICDADTRPLPALLEETLGYFRDPSVAWVQTPQSFYDLDPGVRLPDWLARRARLGRAGRAVGRAIEAAFGPIAVGADRLGSDPRAFYHVVQRCRNWCNAAFCCGAGSVHRREAVMEGALTEFGAAVEAAVRPITERVPDRARRATLATALASQAARRIELTPYEFHVSEDIYTSIRLHAAPRPWRSVYHPRVLTRMLSPQDLLAWSIQRFKYASGTLDIALHDNPLRLRRLTAWQKVMYGATMYAYLAPLWVLPLMLAPLAFFFAGVTPVRAYDGEFAVRIVPFLLTSRLAVMVGTWGVPTWRGEQYHLASFWLNLRALVHVVARRPLRFPVTPKIASARRPLGLVVPHLVLLGAIAAGLVYRGVLLTRPLAAPGEATAYAANLFWSLHNAACLAPFVMAALVPRRQKEVVA